MVHCTKLGKPISLILKSRLGARLPQHKLLQGFLIPWIQTKKYENLGPLKNATQAYNYVI
jgi:hypothetical protein